MAKHGGFKDEEHLRASRKAAEIAQGYDAALRDAETDFIDVDPDTRVRLTKERDAAVKESRIELGEHTKTIISRTNGNEHHQPGGRGKSS